MDRPGNLSYRFDDSRHWGGGAISGFEARDGDLAVAPPLVPRRVAGSEADSIAAADRCGRPVWLRRTSSELVVLHTFGPQLRGRIGVQRSRAIHVGRSILWVRGCERMHRYAARTLQELGQVEVPGLVASAADGGDGVWLLVRGDEGATVHRLDRDGRLQDRPIALPALSPAGIASDPKRRRLAILDAPADAAPAGSEWRLHIVDLARCEVQEPLRFALAPGETPPRRIAIDGQGGFRLASAEVPTQLLGVSAEGIETSRQSLTLPGGTGVDGLFWLDGLVLAGADGLYRLGSVDEEEAVATARGVFITPTLKSPPATPSGWNRAEMVVDLPSQARLTATVFASADPLLVREVEEIRAATVTKPSSRVALLDALLASSRVRAQSYRGSGPQTLHLLLDAIAAPYLWLKLEVECPAGAEAGTLRTLRVRYPDRSWMDELPAIYRDNRASAAQLRQFLAPFEALYGDIDEAIDRLPGRIDPQTASDDWLPWLLGWLGFPPTAGLRPAVQRRLLDEAGTLLAARGTLDALRRMLDIVTENRATVEDSGGRPAFWVIGDSLGRLSPRLGCSTRIAARQPVGFRPGRGLRLGDEPLPPLCTEPHRVLRVRCGVVRVGVDLVEAEADVVKPILDSLLAMFVPAHCTIALDYRRAGRTRRGGRLHRGWRLDEGGTGLDDVEAIELGSETRAGVWRLPEPDPVPFTIDENSALDGARRLA